MLKVRMGTSTSDLSVLLQENCHICLVEDTVPHSSVKITTVIRLLGLLPFHTTFPERTVPGSDSTLFYPHEIKSLAWCSKCKFSLLHKFTFVPAFCTVPVAHFQCYALSCSLLSDSVSCRTSIAMEVNDSCGKKKISKLLKIWWCLSGISFWGGTNGWELLLWIKQLSVHLECTLKRSDCFSYKYPTHMTLSALHCVKFWNQNDFWPPHLKSHQFCLGDLSTVFYGEKINQCLRHNFGGNYVMNEQMFT